MKKLDARSDFQILAELSVLHLWRYVTYTLYTYLWRVAAKGPISTLTITAISTSESAFAWRRFWLVKPKPVSPSVLHSHVQGKARREISVRVAKQKPIRKSSSGYWPFCHDTIHFILKANVKPFEERSDLFCINSSMLNRRFYIWDQTRDLQSMV